MISIKIKTVVDFIIQPKTLKIKLRLKYDFRPCNLDVLWFSSL